MSHSQAMTGLGLKAWLTGFKHVGLNPSCTGPSMNENECSGCSNGHEIGVEAKLLWRPRALLAEGPGHFVVY